MVADLAVQVDVHAGAAEAHGVTPAQVVLRWHLDRGHIVFPKSSTKARIVENIDVFGFELTSDERDAITALERAGITCNKNGVPFDPLPPVKTSGIRIGSPAGTTRGFGEAEFRDIADMVADVLDGLQTNGHEGNGEVEQAVNARVRALCARFPIYQG